MTRERYMSIMPIGMFVIIAIGFVLGAIFPDLQATFYLVLALVAGAMLVLVDRMFRKRVSEPVNDERLQGMAEHAAWLAFKISFGILLVASITLMTAFPENDNTRLVGVGAYCALGVQGLAYGIAYLVIRNKTL